MVKIFRQCQSWLHLIPTSTVFTFRISDFGSNTFLIQVYRYTRIYHGILLATRGVFVENRRSVHPSSWYLPLSKCLTLSQTTLQKPSFHLPLAPLSNHLTQSWWFSLELFFLLSHLKQFNIETLWFKAVLFIRTLENWLTD